MRPNTFPKDQGQDKDVCSHPPLLFNIVWEVVASALRQKKKLKEPGLERKEENYLYLQMTESPM